MPATLVPGFGYMSEAKIAYGVEADSQTFRVFAPLVFNASSGKVELFAAVNNNYDSSVTNKLIGFALRPGRNQTGITDNSLPYLLIEDTSEFMLPVWAASAADAEYQDVTAGAQVVLRNVGGIPVLNLGVTSNPVAVIREKTSAIAGSERFALVRFNFLRTALRF